MDESLLTARDGVSDDQRMQALHRFQGAVSLAQAAAATDASYKPLEQSLIQAYNGYVTRFDSGPESKKALEKARHICADL
ncbi:MULTISPECIES: hypothetical protein [Streptomyces]|jgi:hypothetical protein|uniref:Uncharacterized protein n=1 Tax=Streptomyces thermoviolaceus subsp. thermoviolaceus TaxID=66860 RepID=A0ABX0YRG4_STRTL|nr:MULTISPECIES: hypothetical protein [Streptomyces]MCM3262976.1 hypothetical protein [Streptomyces thermoviolaceus]NJP15167.1 hypothetical protein [Streptomyces thermoviolaceus subsp. thermoviolaceus]RSS07727.1 hypothetical protein EF917_04235 [Streptomyces sp. WAC00469]WTD47551.1 hypothetical protein OG899_08480 [Streptomyces thermoviolaceus]GGV75378.1 hypothetical protein GCM10010499_31530 [Streptomyces thermoviolaceus subsp. apingens]